MSPAAPGDRVMRGKHLNVTRLGILSRQEPIEAGGQGDVGHRRPIPR